MTPSALGSFGRYLVSQRIISARRLLSMAVTSGWSRDSQSVGERMAALLQGVEVDRVRVAADAWVDAALRSRGVAAGLVALQESQSRGHHVLISTVSPQVLASAAAAALGARAGFGTAIATHQGRYLDEIHGPLNYGPMQADRVLRWLTDQAIEPSACWALASSLDDLPLLNSVGRPIVINGPRLLRSVARSRGWPVLRSADDWLQVRR